MVKRILPSSDFQVASLEVIRLPTLKELVGYPANDFITTTSSSFENIADYLSVDENDTNFVPSDNDVLEDGPLKVTLSQRENGIDLEKSNHDLSSKRIIAQSESKSTHDSTNEEHARIESFYPAFDSKLESNPTLTGVRDESKLKSDNYESTLRNVKLSDENRSTYENRITDAINVENNRHPENYDPLLARIFKESDGVRNNPNGRHAEKRRGKNMLTFGERITDAKNVENNIANEKNDENTTSGTNGNKIDSTVSSSIFKPTTMRGIPLADLLTITASRGFYVTKSDALASTTRIPEIDTSLTSEELQTDTSSWQVKTDTKSTTVYNYNSEEFDTSEKKTETVTLSQQQNTKTDNIESSTVPEFEESVISVTSNYVNREHLQDTSIIPDVITTVSSEKASLSYIENVSDETVANILASDVDLQYSHSTTEKSLRNSKQRIDDRVRERTRGRARGRVRSTTVTPTTEETQEIKRTRKHGRRTSTVPASVTSSGSPMTSVESTTLTSTISNNDYTTKSTVQNIFRESTFPEPNASSSSSTNFAASDTPSLTNTHPSTALPYTVHESSLKNSPIVSENLSTIEYPTDTLSRTHSINAIAMSATETTPSLYVTTFTSPETTEFLTDDTSLLSGSSMTESSGKSTAFSVDDFTESKAKLSTETLNFKDLTMERDSTTELSSEIKHLSSDSFTKSETEFPAEDASLSLNASTSPVIVQLSTEDASSFSSSSSSSVITDPSSPSDFIIQRKVELSTEDASLFSSTSSSPMTMEPSNEDASLSLNPSTTPTVTEFSTEATSSSSSSSISPTATKLSDEDASLNSSTSRTITEFSTETASSSSSGSTSPVSTKPLKEDVTLSLNSSTTPTVTEFSTEAASSSSSSSASPTATEHSNKDASLSSSHSTTPRITEFSTETASSSSSSSTSPTAAEPLNEDASSSLNPSTTSTITEVSTEIASSSSSSSTSPTDTELSNEDASLSLDTSTNPTVTELSTKDASSSSSISTSPTTVESSNEDTSLSSDDSTVTNKLEFSVENARTSPVSSTTSISTEHSTLYTSLSSSIAANIQVTEFSSSTTDFLTGKASESTVHTSTIPSHYDDSESQTETSLSITSMTSTATGTRTNTVEPSIVSLPVTTDVTLNVISSDSFSSLPSILPVTSTTVTIAPKNEVDSLKLTAKPELSIEVEKSKGTDRETATTYSTLKSEVVEADVHFEDTTLNSLNVTAETERFTAEKSRSILTSVPPSITTYKPAVTRNNEIIDATIAPRRHRIRPGVFGNKISQRTNVYRRVKVRPVTYKSTEERSKDHESGTTQYPRRRVIVYRSRKRKPFPNLDDDQTSTERRIESTSQFINKQKESYDLDKTQEYPSEEETGGVTSGRNETRILPGNEKSTKEDEEEKKRRKEEKEEDVRDPLRREENTERPVNEVSRPKGAGSSRKPASPPSQRLRKPVISSTVGSLAQNKSQNITNRKHRPINTTIDYKTDTKDVTEVPVQENKETERSEVSDQSSRAQELAVTLADPPSSGTGRLPLRDTIRRKISTTITPRTDTTTSRSTGSSRTRQRPKTQKPDNHLRNVTTRPRRPSVIDYDYYEDEEEPVVGKSTFNGKLFLTSKGTIRCLDQGNFPHPYSCKKFITCARMVNGQVIGAEYTCPDKLSFDPVGGICNWSAGLGCKE